MHPLRFDPRNHLSMLCLGAHADDIEIGCGGTVLRLLDEYPCMSVNWVVFSADGPREEEAKASATEFLCKACGAKIAIHKFRDGGFPSQTPEIKETFEQLKGDIEPDLILTHTHNDAHQDHRVIAELTAQTFRMQMILGYEIPKYDCDLGNPNFYVPLAQGFCERKIEMLIKHFITQRSRHWFDAELFQSLLRLRGMNAVASSGRAEAFYCGKVIV